MTSDRVSDGTTSDRVSDGTTSDRVSDGTTSDRVSDGTTSDQGHVGDIAIVLHTHMPYVEGFGTFPFGEEWIYDAVCRCYLRLLPRLRDVTLTVTPVLADQLEVRGLSQRTREFVERFRIATAHSEAELVSADARAACIDEAGEYERGLELLEDCDGDLLEPFRRAGAGQGVELWTSAATHAVLPLVATTPGRRIQLDAGLRSHRRRFGEPGGFWLPECAYEPGLEWLLAEAGIAAFCTDQTGRLGPADHMQPIATAAGPVALPIDWPTVTRVWSFEGYPSDPRHCDFARRSLAGVRAWSIAGSAYDPQQGRRVAAEQAREFAGAVAARLLEHSERTGAPGLLTFAVDTELLGHWWWAGPDWIAAVLDELSRAGVRALTASQALAEHQAAERPLGRSSWGEAKDLRTWDSRPVADLAWASRRLELRVLGDVAVADRPGAAEQRAVRELLAAQSSDWAFLDARRQAGDYAFQRATGHARAALEAIESRAVPEGSCDARLRNLAPDLGLRTIREP